MAKRCPAPRVALHNLGTAAKYERRVVELEKLLADTEGRAGGADAAETRRLQEALDKAGREREALERRLADADKASATHLYGLPQTRDWRRRRRRRRREGEGD